MLMGHSVVPCRVADLCSSGFFLTQISDVPRLLSDLFNPLVVGSEAEVVVMPSEGLDHPLRFRTRITRIESDSLGVELVTPGHADALTLLAIATENNKASSRDDLASGQRPVSTARVTLVERLRDPLSQALDQILEHFFDLAADKLLVLASQAVNNTIQTQHFDLIGELNNRHDLLSQRFRRPLLKAWAAFAEKDVKIKAIRSSRTESDLSVVDKDEFEDWLTINVMVTNAEAEHRQQIEWLQGRLSVLAGREIDSAHNPLSPDYIYGCLHDATQVLSAPPSLLQQLYKIFEVASLSRLDDLYRLFNTQLKDSGILPDIETRRKKTRVSPAETSAFEGVQTDVTDSESPVLSPESAAASGSVASSAKAEQEQPVSATAVAHSVPNAVPNAPLKVVQDLLAWRRESASNINGSQQVTTDGTGLSATQGNSESNSVTTSASNAPDWTEVELMDALTTIQGALQSQPLPDSGVNLRTQLSGVLQTEPGGEAGREFTGSQQDYIDIVDSLFDSLVENQNIPDKVKPWLRTQQVPLLKVLVRDQSFFSNTDHPARQVLNKMSKLACAPSGAVESMQKTLRGFCDKILNEYDNDPRVYEDVDAELSKLEARQNQAVERNTQRLVRTYEGQQRLLKAKRIVGCEIDLRIGGRLVPPVILELFDIGLRDIMVLIYVREGIKSESWKDQWQLVDQLLDWLGVRSHWGGGTSLERSLEADAFLEMIVRHLDSPAIDRFQRDEVMDSLRELLTKDASEHDRSRWVKVPILSEARDTVKPSRTADDELQRWRQRAKRMQVGDWLAPISQEDQQEQIKLAWIGDGFSSFVFVNKQGLKAIEYDLDALAKAMSEGLVPTEHVEESLLDKGMFKIVQNVYRDMAYQTSHDQLTGLLSRKAFETKLRSLMETTYGSSTTHSLCYIDVDFFKAINSNCGTEAGDQLLQEIALVLDADDIPVLMGGRVGGNEFAVVLENQELDSGVAYAEQLRRSVEGMEFFWKEEKLPQTVSIGVCELGGNMDPSVDLIKQATSACQQAKDAGRNRVVAFQYKEEAEEKKSEMGMLAFIQRALDEKLLGLRCQQIKYIGTEGASGHYEVLLTVRDEEDNNVPLDSFIMTAEKHNRMQTIDRWVISNILEWIAANPRQAKKMGSYSINLSGNSLNDDHLMEFILECFSKTGVDPKMICFEVTETATIENIAKTADFIREMKKFGCRFSLDDFGTGLSSFAYLKQLPVDYLKIDGVFIKDIAESSVDYAMVKSIKEVGHFMGMGVVAEYVESEDIIRCLREIGIDFAQGYAIERPKSLAHYQKQLA